MRLPPTLSFYVARVFMSTIISVFAGCLLLIYLIDLNELLRRASGREDLEFTTVAMMSAVKLPGLAERGLPFIVFVGSLFAFNRLSKRQELVVARAAGVSVWQFVTPGCFAALIFGILTVIAYNPIAASGTGVYEHMQAEHFLREAKGLFGRLGSSVWLRQSNSDGSAIIGAQRVVDRGSELYGVVAYQLDQENKFVSRTRAEKATLETGRWRLEKAWTSGRDGQPSYLEEDWIETTLSRTQVAESLASPTAISFWDLPQFIAIAERAGLSAERYRVHYEVLLAQPVLFCAMVMVAALFSIRSARSGGAMRMVIGSLVVGLVLFLATHISRALGGSGALPPTVAAWWPIILAMLASVTALFYLEDG